MARMILEDQGECLVIGVPPGVPYPLAVLKVAQAALDMIGVDQLALSTGEEASLLEDMDRWLIQAVHRRDEICFKCGQWLENHNDDGSCVEDVEYDAEEGPWREFAITARVRTEETAYYFVKARSPQQAVEFVRSGEAHGPVDERDGQLQILSIEDIEDVDSS